MKQERGNFIKLSLITAGAVLYGRQFTSVQEDIQSPLFTPIPETSTPYPTATSTIEPTNIPTNVHKSEIEIKIEKYGIARSIPSFEYHGDNYDMYSGYAMEPTYFAKQMEWLAENDFHSVTEPELLGYLDGTLQLPGRSIILTTDSGNTSQNSLNRMIPVLKDYKMHFLSFIWTNQMDQGESKACIDDNCWKTFEVARDSGVFTFGCHTETHRDFAKIDKNEGLNELSQSIYDIEKRLAIKVSGLSWPFESCAYTDKDLNSIGLKYAFGGNSRIIMENTVMPNDNLRYCLPRLLPPSPNGVSGRPNNMTLSDIMKRYTTYTE
jgi:peptidoglycan/xylan/chitin deacetylase (PgdA/CDA1 family)